MPRDYEGERELLLVDGDHDLLGDGSVELLSTPGHTPGHQSVRVGERLVIGGDVAHFAASFDDHRFPPSPTTTRRRRARPSGCASCATPASTVLPGHDPELMRPGPVTS